MWTWQVGQPDLSPNRARPIKSMFIVALSAGVTLWSTAVGFTVSQSNGEWHQSLSHDVAYTDGLRLEGWFRPECLMSNFPVNIYRDGLLT
jgi:hypothetical protein